jgi:hypothetical protein
MWTLVGVISFCLAMGILLWRVFREPPLLPEPKPQVLIPIPKVAIEVKKNIAWKWH